MYTYQLDPTIGERRDTNTKFVCNTADNIERKLGRHFNVGLILYLYYAE